MVGQVWGLGSQTLLPYKVTFPGDIHHPPGGPGTAQELQVCGGVGAAGEWRLTKILSVGIPVGESRTEQPASLMHFQVSQK